MIIPQLNMYFLMLLSRSYYLVSKRSVIFLTWQCFKPRLHLNKLKFGIKFNPKLRVWRISSSSIKNYSLATPFDFTVSDLIIRYSTCNQDLRRLSSNKIQELKIQKNCLTVIQPISAIVMIAIQTKNANLSYLSQLSKANINQNVSREQAKYLYLRQNKLFYSPI